MKGNICSHKPKYKGYLELICRCLLDEMYTELTRMKISYKEITYLYKKAHVMVL